MVVKAGFTKTVRLYNEERRGFITMAKDRKVGEVIGELMERYNIDEKTLAEKTKVSGLVIQKYLSELYKDNRSYLTFKRKVKAAFELDDGFFSEDHIWTPKPVVISDTDTKPVKVKKERKRKTENVISVKNVGNTPVEEGTQLFFDQKGKISEESTVVELPPEPKKKAVSTNKAVNQQDSLMTSIRLSGSKVKLSGKKKDITPENAVEWAEAYEGEIKQSIGKVFDVLKESLKGNFEKEDPKPAYPNRKIAEIVELASKAKEEDLNLIIMMLKKLSK